MSKYIVYAIASASRYIGEVEADSPEEAKEKAWELENCYVEHLCHHCAGEVELGDIYEIQAEISE